MDFWKTSLKTQNFLCHVLLWDLPSLFNLEMASFYFSLVLKEGRKH